MVARILPDRALTGAEIAARWRAKNPEKAKRSSDEQRKKNAKRRAEQAREWRERNKERVAEYRAQYERLEKRKAKKRERYAANPEAGRERARSWRQRHPLDVKRHRHEKRARRKAADGNYTAAQVEKLFEDQNHRCANPYCKIDLSVSEKALDHIVALVNGGSNSIENLQWLCIPCNSRKSTHLLDEWLRRESELYKDRDYTT